MSTSLSNLAEAINLTPQPTPKPARSSRRKAAAENWDDDFEFALPARPSAKSSPPRKSVDSGTRNLSPPSFDDRASPVEDWDEPVAGPSRPRISPRTSSRTSTPILHSSPPAVPLSYPQPYTDPSQPTLGSSLPIERNKVTKHPSSSFISRKSIGTRSSSRNSEDSYVQTNRSSPNLPPAMPPTTNALPRSKSGEQMPPPPVPTGLFRVKSKSRKGKEIAQTDDGVRVSNIPFSPSQDQLGEVEKKPGFWKRFSGMPMEKRVSTETRRRRSSSVGGNILPDISTYPSPPPIPASIRSPSAASAKSTTSVSSSNRSGPASALSSILRRSTSSLSRRSDTPSKSSQPPSAYPQPGYLNRQPSSISIARQISNSSVGSLRPPLPTSHSFSRGFHLPSPSPGSPYNRSISQLSGYLSPDPLPSLPHSASFPLPQTLRPDMSDAETEDDLEDNDKTPKRRKKGRPVSALPAPLHVTASTDWSEDGWKTDEMITSPNVGGYATNTLKRISSMSKKHSRRLSGGFKFGTNSSSSSNDSPRPRLETVLGSPSKPIRAKPSSPDPSPPRRKVTPPENDDRATRETSASAPSSVIKPPTGSPGRSRLVETDKERRRQSWNDFVIPREVLAKQRGLREGIGAVKQFATGVEALKTLQTTHTDLLRHIHQRPIPERTELLSLESEFAQYWEMATVLIDLSSSTQAAVAGHTIDMSSPNSPRSHQITLTADESQAQSEGDILGLRKISIGGGGGESEYTPRKSSLPDPESPESFLIARGGPPRASPEQWRASTGRQDLSKRQLEVLRGMLRTPVHGNGRPPMAVRQSSNLSTASVSSVVSSPEDSRATRQVSSGTGISMPSPGDSTYITASDSFSSPHTANMTQGQGQGQGQGGEGGGRPRMMKRRSSKAGLAGLREFLRSLRSGSGSGTPTKEKERKNRPGHVGIPPRSIPLPNSPVASPIGLGLPMQYHQLQSQPQAQAQAQGAGVRVGRGPGPGPEAGTGTGMRNGTMVGNSTRVRSEVGPATRPGTGLATGIGAGIGAGAGTGTGTGIKNGTGKRTPSPRKEHQKRPSIRNIFRTGSGNWSELVRGTTTPVSTPIPTPPLPLPLPLSNQISVHQHQHQCEPQQKGEYQNQQHISNQSQNPKYQDRQASSRPVEGLPKPSWNFPSSSSSSINTTKTSSTANLNLYPTSSNYNQTQTQTQTRKDATVRPNRKSRIAGLGYPLPAPVEEGRVYTSPLPLGSGEAGVGEGERSMSAPVPRGFEVGSMDLGSSSSLVWGDDGMGRGFGHEGKGASGSHVGRGGEEREEVLEGEGEDPEEGMILALTPENLPVLLEYLRQCQRFLGEWKGRVEVLAGDL